MTDSPRNLMSLDRSSMESYFQDMGEKGFRAKQVLQWVYQKNVTRFSDMTDLSKGLRERLQRSSNLNLPEIVSQQRSNDGTVKWLLKLRDGNCIETVYIPETDRGTLCVSSQVGCGLNCTFCSTARQGFNRNLDVDEIISQVWIANNVLESIEQSEGLVFERHDNDQRRPVTNVVMMGMGEPLENYVGVVRALKILMDPDLFGFSSRRITVSTVGVAPNIRRLMEDGFKVNLALSLHAPAHRVSRNSCPITDNDSRRGVRRKRG